MTIMNTYRGIVVLSGKPYQEKQPDENGNVRKVSMFPIKPITGVPVVSAEEYNKLQEKKRIQV